MKITGKTIQRIKETLSFYRIQPAFTYNQDGLTTVHNSDFMKDPLFKEAYKRGKDTGSWGVSDIHWRAFIACWAANKGKELNGDFVECGVNRGGLAMTVMHYVDFKSLPKKFYLLDTFCGLSDQKISEEERKLGVKAGGYEECYDFVKETFKDFLNVEIIRGTVPETLPLVKSDNISFLSIDMNCVEPEIAAVEYFWDKMVSGSVILLDDYGWRGHTLQKKVFDDFASRHGIQVLSLPTGQGMIFKP